MIENLLNLVGELPDPDVLLFLLAASEVDGDLMMRIQVWSDVLELQPSLWDVVCRSHRRHQLDFDPIDRLSIETCHPLLWEYQQPSVFVHFRGGPANPLAVVGNLYQRHIELAGTWIPFERYFNASIPLTDLLAGGLGMLARGPYDLMKEYADILTANGMIPSIAEGSPPLRVVDDEVVPEDPNLSVLVVGNNFVIASSFDANPAPSN